MKYNKDNPCIKCGEKGASVRYYAKRTWDYGKGIENSEEKIMRICSNCGYSWSEEPLE